MNARDGIQTHHHSDGRGLIPVAGIVGRREAQGIRAQMSVRAELVVVRVVHEPWHVMILHRRRDTACSRDAEEPEEMTHVRSPMSGLMSSGWDSALRLIKLAKNHCLVNR